jgi:hypothetical protein
MQLIWLEMRLVRGTKICRFYHDCMIHSLYESFWQSFNLLQDLAFGWIQLLPEQSPHTTYRLDVNGMWDISKFYFNVLSLLVSYSSRPCR